MSPRAGWLNIGVNGSSTELNDGICSDGARELSDCSAPLIRWRASRSRAFAGAKIQRFSMPAAADPKPRQTWRQPQARCVRRRRRAGAWARCADDSVFGDPSAAGPRRVVSLEPAPPSAEARRGSRSRKRRRRRWRFRTRRVAVDQPPRSAKSTATGELRVAVVEAPEAASAAAPASPLPRAPIAGLDRSRPNGPLPIIAAERPHASASLCAAVHAAARHGRHRHRHRRAWASTPRHHPGDRRIAARGDALFRAVRAESANLDRPRPRARPRSDARIADGAVRSRRRRHRPADLAGFRLGATEHRSGLNNCCRAAPAISASPIIRARASPHRRRRRSRWCRRCAGAGLCSSPSRHRPTHRAQRRGAARGPAQHRRRPHHRRPPRSRRDRRAIAESRSAGAAKSERHRRRLRLSCDYGAGQPLGAGRGFARISIGARVGRAQCTRRAPMTSAKDPETLSPQCRPGAVSSRRPGVSRPRVPAPTDRYQWQMPQGGVDRGESPRASAFREMEEEIGVRPEHVDLLEETPDWLYYEFPTNCART